MTTSGTPSATSLSNRFDHRDARSRLYSFWEKQGYFHSEVDPQRSPYTIVIPPPNVTGALHLGHALNNTLQDILIRSKRMQGFNTLWMPGTDHAGIATQAVVEKRLREEEDKTRHDLGRDKLVQRIWAWKADYETRILSQLQSMGCSCDWQRTRFTLDEVCAAAVRQTFFDLFSQHLIFRGKRLVNWDPFLQTAVSDDEVFHETIKGHFWHFRYPVIDPEAGEPTHVTIATTRPETMLGDTAVAVHPNPASALDKVEVDIEQKLAAAPDKDKATLQAQLDNIRQRRATMLPALEQLRDMAQAGRQLRLPLLDRVIPLIADPWAKPEMGSGCVKITPAHDPNDYDVGRRCDLPMINILNSDGTLNQAAGRYQGLSGKAAREQIISDLDAAQLLVETEDREIDLAHSDRSKTPIEPYLADQWFVRMEQLAQSAMDAVSDGRVNIFPSRYAKGYHDWLSEKRDWPVSRQLWWGHQIPIWSKTFDQRSESDSLIQALQKDSGVTTGRVAFQVEENPDHPDQVTIHVCIQEEDQDLQSHYEQMGLVRDKDVLDTWFSSALWPHSTLGWPTPSPELDYYYPTNALITSRDIITLWVARMVLTGLNNMGDVPFREVFIHPKILDGYGETMSKSKGNGVDPLDVIEKFGADALRYGLAYLTTETQDVRMPVQFECPHCQELINQTKQNRQLPRIQCTKCAEHFSTQWASKPDDKTLPRGAVVSERFELSRNFCNKLWNAARFTMTHLEGYTAGPVVDTELAIEDRWILSRLATVTDEVTRSLNSYKFSEAARTLYGFAWDEFCSFYVEMAKTRLQNDSNRTVAQRVLVHTLDTLVRLLHPMIPFITEEIWQLLGQWAPQRGLPEPVAAETSVMISRWPTTHSESSDQQIEEQFARFQTVLGALREIRSRQGIAPKKAVEFTLRCDPQVVNLLKPMEAYFRSMARATAVDWGESVQPPEPNAPVAVGDMEVFVDLRGLIDVEAEKARLEKDSDKLTKLIAGKEKKLSNANFVERAPAEVVEKERAALTDLQHQLAKTQSALDSLPNDSQ